MLDFYERIDSLLKEKKRSQKEMCEAVGLATGQVYTNWKQRDSIPAADIAVKIAQFLGTSVEYLITGEENNPLAEENRELKEKIKSIAEITKG